MASLSSMPPELMLDIASDLSTEDLGNFRRTCRYIESAIFKTFAREFFSIRWVSLLPDSVENLIEISRHPQLHKHVVEVKICYQWIGPSVDEKAQYERTRQLDFMNNEDWKRRLRLALGGLPNCRVLQVRDRASYSLRPRENASWRGWGITSLERDGIFFHQSSQGFLPQHNSISLVSEIIAVAAEAKLPLQEFSMITTKRTNAANAQDWDGGRFSGLSSVPRFDTLKTLMLCCLIPAENWVPIRQFFESLVNLEVLRLNHEERFEPNNPYDLHPISATGESLFDIVSDVFNNRSLKVVQIGKVNLTERRLERLTQSFKSLERLYFFRVFMHSVVVGRAGWDRLFDSLLHLPHLHELTVENCYDDCWPVIWKPSSDVSDVWEYGALRWSSKIVIEKQPHNSINMAELKGRMVLDNEELQAEVHRVHMEAQNNVVSGSDFNSESEDSTLSDA